MSSRHAWDHGAKCLSADRQIQGYVNAADPRFVRDAEEWAFVGSRTYEHCSVLEVAGPRAMPVCLGCIPNPRSSSPSSARRNVNAQLPQSLLICRSTVDSGCRL